MMFSKLTAGTLSLIGLISPLNKKWDAAWTSVAFLNEQTLVLKTDGSIYLIGAGAEQAFDGGKYTNMVNVPLYDAFEVK